MPQDDELYSNWFESHQSPISPELAQHKVKSAISLCSAVFMLSAYTILTMARVIFQEGKFELITGLADH